MPGMVELGEDIFLKPVRRGNPKYIGALSDMVAQPRAATVMGLLEDARLARLRGFKVAQKNGSMKTAFGRFKDFTGGNFLRDPKNYGWPAAAPTVASEVDGGAPDRLPRLESQRTTTFNLATAIRNNRRET